MKNRPTHITPTCPTGTNACGRLLRVDDGSGHQIFSYDKLGNISENIRTFALPFEDSVYNFRMMFEYDSWGRTTSITYPDGETVHYDYDRGGQLFRMYNLQCTMNNGQGCNYLDSVKYDKFGAVTSRKYGNGLKMQYAYHPQNRRLTAISTYNGNTLTSSISYTYDPVGNVTQTVSQYPWLPNQTFTENFAYDSTNQLVSAANPQTYALSVTYGDWGKIQEYDLSQTDLANNLTTSQTHTYNYGSLNEGQTTFAPNNINYADGTNVNEQYGINGSLLRRETTIPNAQPNEELYRFGADGNMRMYSYDRLFYSLYGYDGGTTRTYKYSMDLSPNWVNGRLETVNFNMHNAMFYPNSYINFNNDGYYTKHYYNGTERIASRLGDQNLQIHTHDPELQDRKDWQDSLIRKSVVEITGYEFLPVGEEQNPDDPKPVFELPVIGLNNLQPSTDGIYYYHSNHLGSTCYVTNENATVQQGFLYAPFGEITNEHNSSFENGVIPKYSFNAKELDEETGMYYYEARYMAPPVFISRDPLFEKYPTFSPYAYCANNPVKYVDPDGRDADVVVDNNKKTINITMNIYYNKNNKDFLNYVANSEMGLDQLERARQKGFSSKTWEHIDPDNNKWMISFDISFIPLESDDEVKEALEIDPMANKLSYNNDSKDSKWDPNTRTITLGTGSWSRMAFEDDAGSLSHEIGHGLGLQHPIDLHKKEYGDFGIMSYSYNRTIHNSEVSSIASRILKSIYGRSDETIRLQLYGSEIRNPKIIPQ